MAWAHRRRAYQFLTEDRPWNQEPLALATCKTDGRSCLMIVSRERLECAAKGWLFEAYLGSGRLDRVLSMVITESGAVNCQLKVRFTDGVMTFDKMDGHDALAVTETIAGLTDMARTGNRWERE